MGSDLAAAHFVVHRGGKVRFVGHKDWTQKDKDDEYDLPKLYDETYRVEAIDFEGMDLFYEGLENVRRLQELKYLSFKGVKRFDDWCLDRVSGSEFTALSTLNVAGTKITPRGLNSLYRLYWLKTLIVDNRWRDTDQAREMELTLFMVQDIMPDLEIVYEDVAAVASE